jgi:hypothetical protein
MAWEQRNGRLYYYRKMRQGRQVISEYLGTGQSAELLAELDQFDHEEKMLSKSEWKKQKDEFHKMDGEYQRSSLLIRSLVRAHLLLAGYHPHKGQWRKKRNER